VARLTIGSAIFSDIAALLVLGIILRMPETFDTTAIAHAVAVGSCKLIVFAAIVLLLNHGLRVASGKGSNLFRLRAKLLEKAGPEALFGVSTLFVLAFSAVSETLGLHYVIGAFFGALLLDHDILGSARFKQIQQTTNSMSTGFLGPLFAALGLQLQITSLRAPGFVVSLILVAVVSKVCAGLLATAIMGLNRRAAFQLGSLLNGRGVMGIVVADIALQRGFIGQDLFSVLILMSIVTTAVTPLLVRLTEPRTTTV
jgi:Kef-type K+ transport system membrane component KefB